MKKTIIITSIALLIIPQVTFAAWWNPTTWSIFSFIFHYQPQVETVITATTSNEIATNISSSTPSSVATTTVTTTEKTVPVVNVPVKKVVKKVPVSVPTPPITVQTQIPQQVQQPVQLITQIATSTVASTTINTVSNVDKGTPYKGQDGNWYYPNAYDANGRNLQVIIPASKVIVTVNPTSVKYRGIATLNWTAQGATSCTLDSSPVLLSPTGSQTTGSLGQSTTYTLTCTGQDWTASGNATVNVQQPILPPSNSPCSGATLVGWQIDTCAKEYPDLNW